jgi:hypothetical protein
MFRPGQQLEGLFVTALRGLDGDKAIKTNSRECSN